MRTYSYSDWQYPSAINSYRVAEVNQFLGVAAEEANAIADSCLDRWAQEPPSAADFAQAQQDAAGIALRGIRPVLAGASGRRTAGVNRPRIPRHHLSRRAHHHGRFPGRIRESPAPGSRRSRPAGFCVRNFQLPGAGSELLSVGCGRAGQRAVFRYPRVGRHAADMFIRLHPLNAISLDAGLIASRLHKLLDFLPLAGLLVSHVS